MVAQMTPLKEWTEPNGLKYAHALQLYKAGLLPFVFPVGRRLFVHLGLADEFARSGGAAFEHGWAKHKPNRKPKNTEPQAAAGR
jgi:hypothetical protein